MWECLFLYFILMVYCYTIVPHKNMARIVNMRELTLPDGQHFFSYRSKLLHTLLQNVLLYIPKLKSKSAHMIWLWKLLLRKDNHIIHALPISIKFWNRSIVKNEWTICRPFLWFFYGIRQEVGTSTTSFDHNNWHLIPQIKEN